MWINDTIARRIRYGRPIIVVSGLPRSGTSMMMNMLQAGGIPIVTDRVRQPDENNPRGYFEFEGVKELDKNGDLTWLPQARGKAVKIVSFLLTWLPDTYDYRVVFMQRDLDEVIASQNKLLASRGERPRNGEFEREDGNRARRVYEEHLQQVARFLESRDCFRSLSVTYRDVIDHPDREARRVSALVERPLDIDGMTAVVDRGLYRNRG